MSKAALWKECKERSIAFDKPYAALTASELKQALEIQNAPSEDATITRDPTDEELKEARRVLDKARKEAKKLKDLKTIERARKMQESLKAQDAPSEVATVESDQSKLKKLRDEAKEARKTAQELKAAASAKKAQESLDAIKAQMALAEAAEAKKALRDLEKASEVAQPPTETIIRSECDELLQDAKEAEADGKPFRVQNQRFFLTYKTHLDKELVASFFGEKNVKECICAHENADESSPYEHTHVYIDFGRNYQSTNARVFDFQRIHPNIKTIRSAKHLENIWAYLCKEDSANEYLLDRITKQTLFDKVAACKNVQEVMRLATKPGDAMGLLTLFDNRGRAKASPPTLAHTWQSDLIAELEGEPHKRRIIWYYDPVGNTGKSDVSLFASANDLALIMTQIGGDRDGGQLIETALANGWDGRAIIIDIPRQGEHRSIYSPLEAMKNGLITNVKYKGGNSSFPRPHIVVMANFLPRVHELSLDRWDVRMLESVGEYPNLEISVKSLNVHTVDRMQRETLSVTEQLKTLADRACEQPSLIDALTALKSLVEAELSYQQLLAAQG